MRKLFPLSIVMVRLCKPLPVRSQKTDLLSVFCHSNPIIIAISFQSSWPAGSLRQSWIEGTFIRFDRSKGSVSGPDNVKAHKSLNKEITSS